MRGGRQRGRSWRRGCTWLPSVDSPPVAHGGRPILPGNGRRTRAKSLGIGRFAAGLWLLAENPRFPWGSLRPCFRSFSGAGLDRRRSATRKFGSPGIGVRPLVHSRRHRRRGWSLAIANSPLGSVWRRGRGPPIAESRPSCRPARLPSLLADGDDRPSTVLRLRGTGEPWGSDSMKRCASPIVPVYRVNST